jgi:oxygen-independent coproporphyrinogen-3 oxidase
MHLYIHIPFCLEKCKYCAFASVVVRNIPEQRYIDAVLEEVEKLSQGQIGKKHKIDTLYLGGGTPTTIGVSQLGRLIENVDKIWPIKKNAEISTEANPETISPAYAKELKSTGINRISLGIQSFSERLLKYLGRIHSAEKAINAYHDLRDAGFENINIDLMYGIPIQKIEELEHDLEWVEKLSPEHVSAYLLQHETGTFFEDIPPCPEGTVEQFFYMVIEKLKEINIHQYEISNFAKKSFECRHNLSYWTYKSYLGLGAAAVSSPQSGIRWKNISDPSAYMKKIEQGETSVETCEHLSKEEVAFERKFLSLRTSKGIDAALMPANIPQDLYKIRNGIAVLTPKGMLVSNEILSRL